MVITRAAVHGNGTYAGLPMAPGGVWRCRPWLPDWLLDKTIRDC